MSIADRVARADCRYGCVKDMIATQADATIAAKDAEIARLREALSAICAPNPDCSGDADAWHEHWRNLACARAEIARDTLARAALSQESGR